MKSIPKFFLLSFLLPLFIASVPISAFAAVTSFSWTQGTSIADTGWRTIAWSPDLSLFVAISNSSNTLQSVMTSPDGVTWTLRTAPNMNGYRSVIWVHELGLFVAAGQNGGSSQNIMTSPDGINWTAQTAVSCVSVTWSPSLHLLVASGQVQGATQDIQTSPDGVTWTPRTIPNDRKWVYVVWSPDLGLFLAVNNPTSTTPYTMTSPDGITWTEHSYVNPPAGLGGGVVWSHELGEFVGTGYQASSVEYVSHSTDGINWTFTPGIYDSAGWLAITYSPELQMFVMTSGVGGGAHSAYSRDGVNWTDPGSGGDDNWVAVTWAGGLAKFVAVSGTAGTGNQVMASNLSYTPTISAVSATPASTTATVTWTTDISSSSQVNYGLTSGYGSSTVLDSTLVKSHSVNLAGLAVCGTTYHYQVSSTYVGQNSLSGDNTFTTTPCLTPTLSTTTSSPTGGTATLSGNITGTGGSPVTARGFYWGATSSYGSTTVESGSFSTGSFSAAISGLSCGTTYHYQAYATNAIGTSTGTDQSFANLACHARGGTSVPSAPVSIPAVTPPVMTPIVPPSTPAPSFSFSRTLKLGMTGPDVTALQEYLNARGFTVAQSGPGSLGSETEYFGLATKAALMRFQSAMHISPAVGFFGPVTMGVVE